MKTTGLLLALSLPLPVQAAPYGAVLALASSDLVSLCLVLLIAGTLLAGVCLLIFYLLSLPLRREERTRFFLDLMELGLKDGRGLERTLIGIAHSREPAVGVHFHLLAAYLESGLSFPAALAMVPQLAPPQIAAMLGIGAKIGDLSRVLPACRKLLSDAASKTRGALNYLVILIFVLTPVVPLVFGVLVVAVFPKFIQMIEDLGATPAPLFSWVAQHSALLIIPIVLAALLVYLAALFYIGGPRLVTWLGLESGRDWLRWRVPWQRKRLKRDFSTMLALLLDAGVPEDQAVTLAAESTGNQWFKQKALILNEEVRHGVKLTEAISRMDESGEFGWRFANAVQAGGGFMRALSGWHESLDARAFQQEQAAAQALTSLLVIFNGLVVGLLAVAVFQSLIAIIQEGLLW